jgi:hypothetical protein
LGILHPEAFQAIRVVAGAFDTTGHDPGEITSHLGSRDYVQDLAVFAEERRQSDGRGWLAGLSAVRQQQGADPLSWRIAITQARRPYRRGRYPLGLDPHGLASATLSATTALGAL